MRGTRTDMRGGRLRMPRSRGAASGFLLILLGIWGALIPFVGPYFDFGFSSDQAWAWTTTRGWLEVLPGVVTVVGGKLTTYRRMAEDAVDRVVAERRLDADGCRTRSLPLAGAAPRHELAALEQPRRLVRRYGTDAAQVVDVARSVTGWDDVMAARYAGLTTVRQPMRELGGTAARLLDEVITGGRAEPRHVVLPTELAVASIPCSLVERPELMSIETSASVGLITR